MSANNGEAQACTGLAARVNARASMARYEGAGALSGLICGRKTGPCRHREWLANDRNAEIGGIHAPGSKWKFRLRYPTVSCSALCEASHKADYAQSLIM